MKTNQLISVILLASSVVGANVRGQEPGPSAAAGNAAEAEKGHDEKLLPFEIQNANAPRRIELQIFSKAFCIAMKRHHGEKRKDELRKFFDPRYLRKHGLMEGDLPVQTVPVAQNVEVAEDMKTVLCVVGTTETGNFEESTNEVILLRTTVYEGNLYLSPVKPPDPDTGVFTPWILRVKL